MIRPVRQDGTIETGGPFVPIRRSRVVERIASAATQRVALIVAPAGYGKSVALRHFLETIDRPCVRYDVRAEHNELLGFLRGLCDALGDSAPYARAALAGAYDRNAGSSSPGLDLAQWMHTHLEAFKGVIAVDDLHVAQGDREVTRFVTSLIERTKGRIEWIIASRTTQGLPIGTWLAYGESDLSIDEHDLRFTVDEAKDAARSCKLGVREEELYDLLQLTDGWATAVSFALRTSTRSIDLRQMPSTTREMIYSYLAEQVYAGLNEEERNFLETAALLGEIEPLVMVEAGFDRTVAILEDITSRVAFLHADEDGVYRCHDLFREFLIHQLERRGVETIRARRVDIAATLERLGRTGAALRMYIDAANIAEVQRMLESGFTLIEEGRGDVVLSALSLLERNPRDVTPIAAALRGSVQIVAGHYEDGERRLLQAQAAIDDVGILSRVALQLALLNINRLKDPTPILDALLARSDLPKLTYLEARAMLAVYRSRLKSDNDSAEILSELERELMQVEDDTVRAKLLQRMGLAKSQLGQGAEAQALLEEAAAIADARQLWSLKSRALNTLSNVVMNASYDVSAAQGFAQSAAIASRKAGDYYDLQTSLLMMLAIAVRGGNIARIVELDSELAELRATDRVASMFVVSSQAHRAAWEGRFADAHRLFAGIVQRHALDRERALALSVFALCLALDGRAQEAAVAGESAIAVIDGASFESDGMGSVFFEIARLFAALSECLVGRHTAATRILRKKPLSNHKVAVAFRAGTEEMIILAKNPQYVIEDLRASLDLLQASGFGGYARYLELANAGIHERLQLGDATVKLTAAELRILRDLASGLTPKAIAGEMGRSVLTIETHIKHIIAKLGCRGRAEAVSAGRRMGLLE